MLVTGVAPVWSPIAGTQLLRVTSWQGIFVALAAYSTLMLLVSLMRLPETLPPRGGTGRLCGPSGRSFTDCSLTGRSWAMCLPTASRSRRCSPTSPARPTSCREIHGFPPQSYSAVFAVNALGLVVAAQLSGRLVHRVGARAPLTTATARPMLRRAPVTTAVRTSAPGVRVSGRRWSC